jgi:hypothetical protein
MEEGRISPDSDLSAMGTRLHDAEWTGTENLSEDEAQLVQWCDMEIEKIACKHGIGTWIGEQTLPIYNDGRLVNFGTVDSHSEVTQDTETVILIEKKYGFKEVADSVDNPQVAGGALAIKEKFPWVKKVIAYIINPRLRSVSCHEFTKFAEIKKWLLGVEKACHAPDAPCIPGEWCNDGYCKAIGECDAVSHMSEELITTGVTAVTVHNAEDMYAKAIVVEKHIKAIKAACKRLTIEAGGEIGRLHIQETKGNRYVPDLQKAFESLQQWFDVPDFLGLCDAKLGSMEKEFCSRAVDAGDYQTKSAAKRDFNELVKVAYKPNKQSINLRKG